MSNKVLDYYVQEAESCRSSIPWLAQYQWDSLGDFKTYGFPSRKIEDWKYTSIDAFLKHPFSCLSSDSEALSYHSAFAVSNLVDQQVPVLNGHVRVPDDVIKHLPQGVLVKPLSAMIRDHEALIKPYLGKILQHEHGFHALNSAMLENGVVIYLPRGIQLDSPILIQHWQNKMNQAVYLRHLVIAEADSQAVIIETYAGQEHAVYCTNTVTEIALEARSKITHYKIQCESREAFHLGHVIVRQHESSEFLSHSLSLGGRLVRSDLSTSLQENNACCLLNGIYIPGDKQHIDHHTRVNHLVPDCISEQDYKGILTGCSRAVFNGQVFVAHDAQKTRANQQNKNILLSVDAEIDTKPQLEIHADDVVCSHGATVGQLDEEAQFYLSSRGMDETQVARFLIQAFIANNMQLFEDSVLRDEIMLLINKKLRDYHG